MMNSNEFRISVENSIEVDVLLNAGFKMVSSDEKYILLELPPNWIMKETDTYIRTFYDEKGNTRGATACNYVYLRCRFEIATIKGSKDYFPETERLIVQDKKTDEIIMDFGTFEPYSDYEKDLRGIAQIALSRKYPNWENPLAYWDE